MTHRPRLARRLRSLALPLGLGLGLGVAGCATMQNTSTSLVPNKFQTQTGPFVVYANTPIGGDAQVVRILQSHEQEIESGLGLHVAAAAAPVEVYILNDRDAFNHFLTFYYPELPSRRAFFLAQGPRRVIYTYYNSRLDEDLRHEATHALLNVAVGDLPLWLDEGLAEYYEGPGVRNGLNPEHLARLPDDQKTGWRPDLARLETLKSVREMTPLDYRESWAWVHYLLNGPPAGKKLLLDYLAGPRPSHESPTFAERLAGVEGTTNGLMLTHLEQLRAVPVAAKLPTVEPTFHMQSAPIDTLPRVAPRRGFFDRIFSAFKM